ncbi:MAG: FAD-binding oxidoreductase, partial [Candidatus Korarchaeum sp.]
MSSGSLKEFLHELSRRVGEGKVLTEPEELYSYSLDASTEFKRPPVAVVRASSEEDVRAVLELADRSKVPVVPRGSGTSLTGGPVPAVPNAIILDLTPMSRI